MDSNREWYDSAWVVLVGGVFKSKVCKLPVKYLKKNGVLRESVRGKREGKRYYKSHRVWRYEDEESIEAELLRLLFACGIRS